MLWGELKSQWTGLRATESNLRLKQAGLNEIAPGRRPSGLGRLLDNVKNPLVLLALGGLSFLTGEALPVEKKAAPAG